jgi:Glycosyl hydrolases family 16
VTYSYILDLTRFQLSGLSILKFTTPIPICARMSTIIRRLIPFLLTITALGAPPAFNQGNAASSTGNAWSAQSSISRAEISTSTSKATPTTFPVSSTRAIIAPVAASSVPSKSGCLWNVPDVGSFTEVATYNFTGKSLPSGLKVNSYSVNDGGPFTHSFTSSNVWIDDSFLNLRVPGRQTRSPLKCGEVQTVVGDIRYASVRTLAILSDVPGTCAGMFFYKDDTQEIDIEYLSDPSSLSNDGADFPPPLQYTNQAIIAKGTPTYAKGPAPDDVTTLHEYRIDWIPGRTSFFLDGVLQKSFTDNIPSKAGQWIWNHWTNGDQGFSAGPPEIDSVFKIQSIVMYYNRTSTTSACAK